MNKLWNAIRELFLFKKDSTPNLAENTNLTSEVPETTIQKIDAKENVIQLRVVEESSPEVTEIKLEYIKDDPPKRKKEAVVETTTASKKRGPKKSKKI